jgi:hypothetical protein
LKHRFDAHTDVAMVGAWDAERGAQPLSAEEHARLSDTLDAEAAEGHVFVLHTGGDGGGPVEVYIDEPIPTAVAARLTPQDETFILAVPSGALDVDGVEYYRSRKPDPARSGRAISVPPGEYVLRCYTAKNEEGGAARTERGLEAVIGKDDLRYYERVTRGGCLTALGLLVLFPALLPFFGWKVAFATTIVVVVLFFNVREWVLRRNARFARLRERVTAFRLQHAEPTVVLELRRAEDRDQ